MAFRERVLDWLENTSGREKRKLRPEQTDREHGEQQAARMIKEMLAAVGLSEAELHRAPKGDWRKRLIGYRVRRETSASLGWLGARLRMGSEGHVSRITSTLPDLNRPERRLIAKLLQNARKKD